MADTDPKTTPAAPPVRKRPKPGERRVQILQALATMLEQPGAERITTAALAAKLDVSEAALYRHFASKAQMFEGLIEFIESSVFTLINQAGGKAVGLTGRDGGMIRARKLKMQDAHNPAQEVDVGQVGDIIGIDPSVVKALQDDAFIPVISPIGFGDNNESYNINADLVASKLATVLKAEKLVLLTNTPGVLDKSGQLLTNLSARQIDDLFADGTISGGMLPKISGALDAAKSGVNSVHIIDGRVPHAMLLEILTDQAYGTMIRSH